MDKLMKVRVEDKCGIKEILISDEAQNHNIPNASYVPAVRILITTNDGRAYSGHIFLDDLAEKLSQIKTVSGTKLFKNCQIKT